MRAPVKVDTSDEIRKREVKQSRKVISSQNSISERSSSSLESGSSDYDSDSDEYLKLEQLQQFTNIKDGDPATNASAAVRTNSVPL